jgi:hypothetical protein
MAAELSLTLGLPCGSPEGLGAPVVRDKASKALLLLPLPLVRLLLLPLVDALMLPPSCELLLMRPLPLKNFWLEPDRPWPTPEPGLLTISTLLLVLLATPPSLPPSTPAASAVQGAASWPGAAAPLPLPRLSLGGKPRPNLSELLLLLLVLAAGAATAAVAAAAAGGGAIAAVDSGQGGPSRHSPDSRLARHPAFNARQTTRQASIHQ